MTWSWLIGAVALVAAAPVAADPANARFDGDICVSVARRWLGTPADVAAIERVPVPQRVRSSLATTGCERWQFEDESLLDWHLKFGTETTTTAALRYLAEDYGRHERFRLDRDMTLDLATFYVRAAEFYRSRALLDAGATFAREVAAAPGTGRWTAEWKTRTGLLLLRRAVLTALLSRRRDDLAAATQIVEERTSPALEEVADLPNGVDVCDGPREPRFEQIYQACRAPGSFDREALAFWEARARLALADPTANCHPGGVDLDAVVARLVASIQSDRTGFDWPDEPAERAASLLLLRADVAASVRCGENDIGRYEALAFLRRAERLVPAAVSPALFGMIADRFIALADASDNREVAYFRTVRAHLGEIATGGPPVRGIDVSPRLRTP